MKIVFKEYIGGKITMKKKRKSEADNKTFRIARDKNEDEERGESKIMNK